MAVQETVDLPAAAKWVLGIMRGTGAIIRCSLVRSYQNGFGRGERCFIGILSYRMYPESLVLINCLYQAKQERGVVDMLPFETTYRNIPDSNRTDDVWFGHEAVSFVLEVRKRWQLFSTKGEWLARDNFEG